MNIPEEQYYSQFASEDPSLYPPGPDMYDHPMMPMFPEQCMFAPPRMSLVGPVTENAKEEFMLIRSFSKLQDEAPDREDGGDIPSHRSGGASNASRRGSFSRKMSNVEELRCFYGDMAERIERPSVNGVAAVGTYRGAAGNMAMPRRSAARRGGGGYGSLASRREEVMNAGGVWGNSELQFMHEFDVSEMEMPEPVAVLNEVESNMYRDGDISVHAGGRGVNSVREDATK